MALYHKAEITPTKLEVATEFASSEPWGCAPGTAVEAVGAFRFDDPEGRVGMETHLVSADGVLLQVPLTYRDEPLDGAEDALLAEMHHTVLGTRWVYDGLRDPLFVTMLAAVTMSGQGEALGMVVYDGRWFVAPSNVRLSGGGWGQERVAVDEFTLVADETEGSVLRNERFELTVFRRPTPGDKPPIGLRASIDGNDPVVLAEFRDLGE